MFDFYYSRPVSSAPTSQELTIDIPRSDNYDLLVRLKKRKVTLYENLEMEYFKIIHPGTSIVQKIIKPNNYKNLEFCISTTYISSATNKPSNGIPEKKLNISIRSENTNQNIFSENLNAIESYSPGDWFYNCFSLDEGAVKGTRNESLILYLTSDSKDVMWGVPYRSDIESELGYSIKYQLNGVSNDSSSILKVSAENFGVSKRVDFQDDTLVVLTEKQYFQEGPQTFYFDCGTNCVVDRVYMSKGTSLYDVTAEGNGKIIPILEKYKNGHIEFLLEKNFIGKGVLLFKQSYNHSWELFQNENTNGEHLVLNGYQNGWVISNINDKVQGKIIFRKQSIYNLANIVSLTVLIALATSAILLSLYKTRSKHETNK